MDVAIYYDDTAKVDQIENVVRISDEPHKFYLICRDRENIMLLKEDIRELKIYGGDYD